MLFLLSAMYGKHILINKKNMIKVRKLIILILLLLLIIVMLATNIYRVVIPYQFLI